MPSTQLILLNDLVENLKRHAIKKLLILNSHGGNNFVPIIRELSLKHPEVFICTCDWWKIRDAQNYFTEPGDHAGELETSVMMHLAPELVLPLDVAHHGNAKEFKIEGLKQRWVWAQRHWTSISESTGIGNPKLATEEKGMNFIDDTCNKIAEFILELALADIQDMY